MSTRAYKLIEIKTEYLPTFNLEHNPFVTNRGEENNNIITFFRSTLEQLKEDLKDFETLKYSYDETTKEEYEDIIKQIEKDMGDLDYVEYYTY